MHPHTLISIFCRPQCLNCLREEHFQEEQLQLRAMYASEAPISRYPRAMALYDFYRGRRRDPLPDGAIEEWHQEQFYEMNRLHPWREGDPKMQNTIERARAETTQYPQYHPRHIRFGRLVRRLDECFRLQREIDATGRLMTDEDMTSRLERLLEEAERSNTAQEVRAYNNYLLRQGQSDPNLMLSPPPSSENA